MNQSNPELKGRIARCAYFGHKGGRNNECDTCRRRPDRMCQCERPSSMSLPFFDYQGPGSRSAEEICVCGFHFIAHKPEVVVKNNRVCKQFIPRGDLGVDEFYCGCFGWD